VFDAKGNVDRARLAAIVFAPAAKSELNYLEELTHPRIGALLQLEAAKAGESGCPLVVLDAPVMRKAGWDKMCQAVVYVDAPREVRLARAHQRGWADAQFAAREAAQESILAKRQAADFVIDNSGDAKQTREQVEHIWQTLQEN
jgi:dephospho-CoA kinase